MRNRGIMIIAVDTRFTTYQTFLFQVFKEIAEKHPQHTFLFIVDRDPDPLFISSENSITVIARQSKISLLSQLKISSLLKKYKADVFVSAQTISQTKVPQCLIAWDNFPAGSLKKAKVVITGSAFSKKEIIEKYKIAESKIDVVYKSIDDDFQPMSFERKEEIIEAYADGNEYFLSVAVTEHNNLLNLLKAFSIFKKMQKSGMQLLIVSDTGMSKDFLEALRLYKFKDEVNVFDNISRKILLEITAAAYAFVYPAEEYFHVFPAMRSGVPVLTGNAGVMHEICGNAAIYFHSNDHKDIAEKMMLIYKDENLGKQLIEKGQQQVKRYSLKISSEKLWQGIQKAAN